MPTTKLIEFGFADMPANRKMFIATPLVIDNYIKQIPEGKLVTTLQMRKDLAIEHDADHTCPLTTGIFLRIVAEASFEQFQLNNTDNDITPFWRVIEPNSSIAKKLSFGQDFLVRQIAKEQA